MSKEQTTKTTEKNASAEARAKKVLSGVVVSDAMDKTVVVLVDRFVKDPKYKKYFKMRKKYKAHDEANQYKVGDAVEIVETIPISKDKHFKVVAGK